MNLDVIRAAVRPTVTWGLVIVQATLAVLWATGTAAQDAFAALGPFTMMAMTFYFKERSELRQDDQ